ncbi:MAG: helix-turn-helix transcriptional regulator [Candidatus Komeilibacteria bacterium]|nr:helix-turn-helix transcriptional regulator [Candidatus Komeilibacteria bacterium]
MSLGQYIRELRDQRDLSLREFAKKLGCSAAFLSDIELGRRYPSETVLQDMARILKVSVDDLKARDVRPPIEEIKRITASDPRYALAFRTVIDHGVSPERLLELAKRTQEGRTKSKK